MLLQHDLLRFPASGFPLKGGKAHCWEFTSFRRFTHTHPDQWARERELRSASRKGLLLTRARPTCDGKRTETKEVFLPRAAPWSRPAHRKHTDYRRKNNFCYNKKPECRWRYCRVCCFGEGRGGAKDKRTAESVAGEAVKLTEDNVWILPRCGQGKAHSSRSLFPPQDSLCTRWRVQNAVGCISRLASCCRCVYVVRLFGHSSVARSSTLSFASTDGEKSWLWHETPRSQK